MRRPGEDFIMQICSAQYRDVPWCIFALAMFFTGIVMLGIALAVQKPIYLVGIAAIVLGAVGVWRGRAVSG
jgi:hypothetical protein